MIITSSTMMVTSMIIIISITMVISVIFRTELRVPYIPARALLARACLLISSPSSLSSSSSSLPLWKDVISRNISGVWGFHLREGVVVPHQNKGRYILVQRHYHLDQNHPSVICCHCCLLQSSGALELKRAWRDWEKVFFWSSSTVSHANGPSVPDERGQLQAIMSTVIIFTINTLYEHCWTGSQIFGDITWIHLTLSVRKMAFNRTTGRSVNL